MDDGDPAGGAATPARQGTLARLAPFVTDGHGGGSLWRAFFTRWSLWLFCLALLTSCSSGDDAADWFSEEPDITAHALLDWDTGYIEYPLQAFAMSADEYSVVAAAQNIVFVRCVVGDATFPTSELVRAQIMLSTPYTPRTSPYGLWSAELVAVRGYLGRDLDADALWNPGSSLGDDLNEAKAQCATDEDVVFLRPQSMDRVFLDSESTYFEAITRWFFDAATATAGDSRVQPFSVGLGKCFAEYGYSLRRARQGDDGPPLTLQHDDSWSEAQHLQAGIVEATCNDKLGVTQALSDIEASYEQLIIDAHEAELLAIRAEIELRLERAHQVLREEGLE